MINPLLANRRRTGLSIAALLVVWAHSAVWGLAEAAVAPPEAPRNAMSVRIVHDEAATLSGSAIAPTTEIADAVPTPATPQTPVAAPNPYAPTVVATARALSSDVRKERPVPAALPVVDTDVESAQTSPPAPSKEEVPVEAGLAATFLAQAESTRPAASQQAQASGRQSRAATAARTDGRPGGIVARAETALAPPSTTLHYLVRRGAVSGEGELVWQHDGQAYTLHLSARVPILGVIFDQFSRGQIEPGGLVPTRFTEKRIGKGERAVNFVRGSGDAQPYVSFSSRTGQLPWVVGMQDRLSWMAQLAARLQGWPGEPQAGQRLEIPVVGASGDVQRWHFLFKDSSMVDGERQWHLLREPEAPFDTLAEVWVSPAHSQFPVRVRLTESQGDPLELTLK